MQHLMSENVTLAAQLQNARTALQQYGPVQVRVCRPCGVAQPWEAP